MGRGARGQEWGGKGWASPVDFPSCSHPTLELPIPTTTRYPSTRLISGLNVSGSPSSLQPPPLTPCSVAFHIAQDGPQEGENGGISHWVSSTGQSTFSCAPKLQNIKLHHLVTLRWHVPALYNGTLSLPGHLCAVSSPGSHSIIHPPHQVLPEAIKIWALSLNCLQKSKGNETQGSESRGRGGARDGGGRMERALGWAPPAEGSRGGAREGEERLCMSAWVLSSPRLGRHCLAAGHDTGQRVKEL